jgi:hypothetical protein
VAGNVTRDEYTKPQPRRRLVHDSRELVEVSNGWLSTLRSGVIF